MQSDLQDNAPAGAPSLAAVWRGAGRNYEQVPAVVTSVQHTWATGHHHLGHLATCSLVTPPPRTLVTVTSLGSTASAAEVTPRCRLVMMEAPPPAASRDS